MTARDRCRRGRVGRWSCACGRGRRCRRRRSGRSRVARSCVGWRRGRRRWCGCLRGGGAGSARAPAGGGAPARVPGEPSPAAAISACRCASLTRSAATSEVIELSSCRRRVEQRPDPRPFARALDECTFAALLGCAKNADRRGVAVADLCRVRREAVIGSGDGVRRVEHVDHVAEAVAAEEDRKRRRRGVALVERDDALRDVLHRHAGAPARRPSARHGRRRVASSPAPARIGRRSRPRRSRRSARRARSPRRARAELAPVSPRSAPSARRPTARRRGRPRERRPRSARV